MHTRKTWETHRSVSRQLHLFQTLSSLAFGLRVAPELYPEFSSVLLPSSKSCESAQTRPLSVQIVECG